MSEPAKKSQGIENVLSGFLGGASRSEVIKANRCVPKPIGCGGEANEFKDALSKREHSISGFCQECQDKVFGKRSYGN